MKDNAKKSKANESVKVYANFTKAERESLIKYLLRQYEISFKDEITDFVLIGFLGFNTAFPVFSRVIKTSRKVNGKINIYNKMQSIESTLKELIQFLNPNYENDILYKTSINMVDYVSIKWGFLRICPYKTTSKRRRTELMNEIREYFLSTAGCYPALKWENGGYLLLGSKNPEQRAKRYINSDKVLKKEYENSLEENPVEFLKKKFKAYQGYYERPYGLRLLMILNGEFIVSKDKDYDEAALKYILAHQKIATAFQKQKKLQPAQFLLSNYNAIKIDYFISPQEEEDNLKKFDVIDPQHIPTAQVSIKEFKDKDFVTLAWLIFFYVKGYILSNQIQNEQFNSLFCKKRHCK